MKKSDIKRLKKELVTVSAMPRTMWQRSLEIAEIPQDIIRICLHNGRMVAACEWLDAQADSPAPRRQRAAAPVVPAVPFRQFGVELECVGAVRSDILRECRQRGLTIFSETYNHRDGGHHKIVSDASIRGRNGNEVVTRPLSEFDELKRLVEAVKTAGGAVNTSCGLHVHLDASDLDAALAKRLVNNYYYLRTIINNSLPASRQHNRYAMASHWVPAWDNYAGIANIATFWPRYTCVNLNAYQRHRTVEFRQHQGSLNFIKIRNWIQFLQSLYEWSKTNELTSDVRERTDPRLSGLAIDKLRIRA